MVREFNRLIESVCIRIFPERPEGRQPAPGGLSSHVKCGSTLPWQTERRLPQVQPGRRMQPHHVFGEGSGLLVQARAVRQLHHTPESGQAQAGFRAAVAALLH